jgi:hypothetical protein
MKTKFAIRPDLYQSTFGLFVTIYWNFLISIECSLVSAVLVMSIPTKTNTLLQSWCLLLNTMKAKFAIWPDLYQSKFGLVLTIYWNFLINIECSLVSAVLVISSQPRPTPWCCRAYIYYTYNDPKVCAKTKSVSTQIASSYDRYIVISWWV